MRNTFARKLTALGMTIVLHTAGCASKQTAKCFAVQHTGKELDPAPARICHEDTTQTPQARVELEGGSIWVDFDPNEYEIPRDVLWKWITDAGRAVAAYYGRFPVKQCLLRITPTHGRGARWGEASGHGKMPTVSIVLGRQSKPEDLAEDWTLTHELVHTAFPSMQRQHLWIEEGLATYIEPIARFKIGLVSEESVWYEWVHAMGQGQPEEGDRGLDFTRTWGRVYWGGALFSLVADVAIRRESNDKFGLRHALRGIVDAGASISVWWSITDTLAKGDRAAHTQVLMTEYKNRRADPAPVDLDTLWKNLGVRLENGRVVLDNQAPWAASRRAILRD